MQNMPGWTTHDSKDGVLRFGIYGRQRAYIRVNDYSQSVNGSEDELL